MAQSYSNPGGSGDRTWLIVPSSNVPLSLSSSKRCLDLINNQTGGHPYFTNGSAVSGLYFQFDFGSPRIVDEITWKIDATGTLGNWKVQGSPDASAWTDLGTTFALGTATTQVIATGGNTTAYRYYRLLGMSGSASSGPDMLEVLFRIDDAPAADYSQTLGTGNRTGSITLTSTSGLLSGTPSTLLDGAAADGAAGFSSAVSVTGKEIRFDFGAAKLVNQVRFYVQYKATGMSEGTWDWEGSDTGSGWTTIQAGINLLGSGLVPTGTLAASTSNDHYTPCVFIFGDGNLAGYRYYRLHGTAGATQGLGGQQPNIYEFTFSIGPAPTPPPPMVVITDQLAVSYEAERFPGNNQFTVTDQLAVSFQGESRNNFAVLDQLAVSFHATVYGKVTITDDLYSSYTASAGSGTAPAIDPWVIFRDQLLVTFFVRVGQDSNCVTNNPDAPTTSSPGNWAL